MNQQWTPVAFEWQERPEKLILRTACGEIQIDRDTGELTFTDVSGKMLLQETTNGSREMKMVTLL